MPVSTEHGLNVLVLTEKPSSEKYTGQTFTHIKEFIIPRSKLRDLTKGLCRILALSNEVL